MNPYMNYNPYNMAPYATTPHATQPAQQAQTIQTLSQQSAQQQIYTYFVKSADQLNSIQPMPNTFYLGINADSDQIFVRHMNNDGVTEVKTYTLAGEQKKKSELQIISERLDSIEKKLNIGAKDESDVNL